MRTLTEQYQYETATRGLSHKDALQQMSFMFSAEQLATLDPTQDGRKNVPVKTNTMNNEQNTTTATTDETTPETTPTNGAEKAKKAPINVDNITPEERETLKAEIDAIVTKAKGETENPLKLPMLLDNAGSKFGGDENLPKRVQYIAVLIDAQPSDLMFHRCGPSALGQALSNYGIGENPESDLNVRKTVEESATEQALASGFGAVEASKNLKKFAADEQDVNTIQSIVHAAHHAGLKMLSNLSVDEKGKAISFPRQAADFVSFLVAASSGSTDWFTCNDGFIVEASGMSKATIKRGRQSLLDWQEKTGRGVVSMKQGAGGKGTLYRLELMKATTAIIQNLIGSKHANPENLLIVAGLAGKMLTEGETVKGVGDAELAQARALTAEIRDTVNDLPAPSVERSAAAEASSESMTGKRFTKLRDAIGQVMDKATAAGLDEVTEKLTALSVEMKTLQEAKDVNPDERDAALKGAENRANALLIEVNEATQTASQKAEAEAEAEREATGSVTASTRANVAKQYVAALNAEAYETELDAALEEALNAVARVFALSALNEKPKEAIQEAYNVLTNDAAAIAEVFETENA